MYCQRSEGCRKAASKNQQPFLYGDGATNEGSYSPLPFNQPPFKRLGNLFSRLSTLSLNSNVLRHEYIDSIQESMSLTTIPSVAYSFYLFLSSTTQPLYYCTNAR